MFPGITKGTGRSRAIVTALLHDSTFVSKGGENEMKVVLETVESD